VKAPKDVPSLPDRPRPRPWAPRTSCRRKDAQAWHSLRRGLEDMALQPGWAEALRTLIGGEVSISLVAAHHGGSPTPMHGGVAVELGGAEGETGLEVMIEVEQPLAVALQARALKRPPPRISALDSVEAHLAGGVAAILMAAVRRANPAYPRVVRSAGGSASIFARLGAPWSSAACGTFRVRLDEETFAARALVRSEPLEPSGAGRPFTKESLARLGPMPVELRIVMGTYRTTAAEVASLAEGDAWMLGRGATSDGGNGFKGDVLLAAPGADVGVRATVVEDGRLVLRGERESIVLDPMPEDANTGAVIDAVGDVPLVLRVEIGAARMTAREWAELGVGDVIGLAHRLGEPVVLRVGGVEVAKGELVDLEGEMAVRIVSRQGSGRDP
jgi:flagellar motor switch/type III secretory pathway protein FliN